MEVFDVHKVERLVPVFFVGAPKSGTTFLFSLFDNHPATVSLLETGLFGLKLWDGMTEGEFERQFAKYLKYWSTAENPSSANLDIEAVTQRAMALRREFPGRSLHRICLEAILEGAIEQVDVARYQGLTHFVEKTPRHYNTIEELFRAYPNARVVHVVRDPRDNYLALKRWMRRKNELDFHPLAFLRDRVLSGLSQARINAEKYGPQYKIVFYEDLLVHQDRLIRPICDWIELPWDDCLMEPSMQGLPYGGNSGKEELAGKLHAFDRRPIGRWKKELSAREVVLLDQVIRASGLEAKYDVRAGGFWGWWRCLGSLWRRFEGEKFCDDIRFHPRQVANYFTLRFWLLWQLACRHAFPFRQVLQARN